MGNAIRVDEEAGHREVGCSQRARRPPIVSRHPERESWKTDVAAVRLNRARNDSKRCEPTLAGNQDDRAGHHQRGTEKQLDGSIDCSPASRQAHSERSRFARICCDSDGKDAHTPSNARQPRKRRSRLLGQAGKGHSRPAGHPAAVNN